MSARATTNTVREVFLGCQIAETDSGSPSVFNFLEWSTAYLFFVFLTLVIAQTLPLGTFTASRPYPGVDGQQIAIIALSFFFLFFTSSLLIQHTDLVLKNMTTIEQIGLARMLQRERAALSSEYGFWGFRCVSTTLSSLQESALMRRDYARRPKRETRREWDKRWGRPGREGNLWWLGSKRANWEMVFGQSKLGWFCTPRLSLSCFYGIQTGAIR